MKNNPFLFLLLLLIAACTPSNQQSDINTDTIEADISETPEQNDTHLTSQEENNSPKTESLSDRLWAFVDGCYGAIYDEEYEDNGFSERVDDAKNGYVHISGSWPTCGCSCSSTAGAYKNEKGEYILLKNEH
ncbi:MAG: hypothetical protein OEY34_08010, partial [Cyclobacteriaceae bacterium]|nr:hypothetical protein [Cyclobacteriaceae bacterium]